MWIGQLLALLPGDEAEHAGLAAAGEQDAGQDLDGGGFARPVRTDETEQFARFHLERQAAHRLDGSYSGRNSERKLAPRPGGLALGVEGFGEIGDLDGGHVLFYIMTRSDVQ